MELNKFYKKIQIAYNQLDVELKNNGWYYSLCTSIPKEGQPLIVDFNWDVDLKNKEQTINDLEPKTDWDRLGDLKKVKTYLEKSFTKYPINDYNQVNYCFFRSRTENQISQKDIEICEPIFFDFISKVKPEYIVSFSSKLRDIFLKKGLLKYYTKKTVFDGEKNNYAYHGFVQFGNWWTYIYFLPHPSRWNRLRNQKKTLNELWKICQNTFPYEVWLADFLNYLESIGKQPKLSENPIDEVDMRSNIFTHNREIINISNISFFQIFNKELQSIQDFDINDMTSVLKCYKPEFDKEKFENYIDDKKKGLNMDSIIKRNFDKDTFEWSYNIVRIGLQKLYIYTKYLNDRIDYLKLER